MNIELRLEQPEDYRKTEEIMREAFWNYYAPGCYEHYLLHIMRNSPNFVKELDFVAVWENKIIGSVVCLKSFIAADNGNKYEVLSMGPIAVLPKYQRMGVGKALIAHTRSVAAEMGYRAILCPLWPDALAGVTGQYYEDEIYNINIAEAEEFDRSFPKKERITGTPTQKRFEEVVAMQKEYMQPSGK